MKTRKFSCLLVLLLHLGGVRSSEAQSNYYTNIWVDKLNSEQSECSIALNPLDKNIQFIVWNDFRNVPPESNPGYAFSTDMGETWTAKLLALPEFEPGLPYGKGFDPSCAINRQGRFFYCYCAVRSDGVYNIMVSHDVTTPGDSANWYHGRIPEVFERIRNSEQAT